MTPTFPTPTREDWRRRVEDELGPDREFERALVTRTLEGLPIAPLYTEEDADEAGPDAASVTPRSGGTTIAPAVLHPAPRAANRQMLDDLENGAAGTYVALDRATRGSQSFDDPDGRDGVRLRSLDDLDALLDGVFLDAIPVALGTNANGLALAASFVALARERDADPARVELHLGVDPLATLAADGALPGDVDDARRELCALALHSRLTLDRARSLAVDAGVWHRAGGHPVLELGYALSGFVETLRWLEDAGLPPGGAHSEFVWRFDIGRDVFTEIAKLRAARLLHAKVLGSAGVASATPLVLHATTSPRSLARRDPWTNMLRTTLGTFAAMAGGADLVTTLPHDAALGPPGALGRRNARNVGLVLARESRLDHVGDPARGAYAIEARTAELARAAWDLMRDVERGGGLSAALATGRVDDELGAARDALRSELATRRRAIVGVSVYPIEKPVRRADAIDTSDDDADRAERLRARGAVAVGAIDAFEHAVDAAAAGATVDEIGGALVRGARRQREPLPSFRDAGVFEDLADAADLMDRRPRVHLACLGPLAAHGARANFAAQLFRAGGLEVVKGRALTDVSELGQDFGASGASIACVCGTDEAYERDARAAIEALREAGARSILIARREREGDGELRAAGLDGHVHAGCDAVRVLRGLLELEGAVLGAEEAVL